MSTTGAVAPPATPDWLLAPEVGLCPCGCIGRRSKRGFVARTIAGGTEVLRQALRADDVARADGLLQRLDPRVKVVTTLGLLVSASFVHHLPVLLGLYAATLVLAASSAIPVGFFVRRVWLFIPLFTGVIVLPATLDVITPGHVVVPLGSWFGHPVGLTAQGLEGAGLIVSRVAVSISLVVLLTLTTAWTRLLASLRSIGVPKVFVLVLGMTYRYVFVLLDVVTDQFTARQARTVKVDRDGRTGRAFVAASAGALFAQAHDLSGEVHAAMVSRGWTGDARTLRAPRPTLADAVWIGGCIATIVATVGIDRLLGG